MPPEARLHEAPVALDGGPDGLAVLRRVAEGAARWLAPGGHLVVEAGEGQVEALRAALTAVGLHPTVTRTTTGTPPPSRPAARADPRRRPPQRAAPERAVLNALVLSAVGPVGSPAALDRLGCPRHGAVELPRR